MTHYARPLNEYFDWVVLTVPSALLVKSRSCMVPQVLVPPATTIHVPANATWDQMQEAFTRAAATDEPVLVQFTGTPQRVDVDAGDTIFINLTSAQNIRINGGGSVLTFTTYVSFVSSNIARSSRQ